MSIKPVMLEGSMVYEKEFMAQEGLCVCLSPNIVQPMMYLQLLVVRTQGGSPDSSRVLCLHRGRVHSWVCAKSFSWVETLLMNTNECSWGQ